MASYTKSAFSEIPLERLKTALNSIEIGAKDRDGAVFAIGFMIGAYNTPTTPEDEKKAIYELIKGAQNSRDEFISHRAKAFIAQVDKSTNKEN